MSIFITSCDSYKMTESKAVNRQNTAWKRNHRMAQEMKIMLTIVEIRVQKLTNKIAPKMSTKLRSMYNKLITPLWLQLFTLQYLRQIIPWHVQLLISWCSSQLIPRRKQATPYPPSQNVSLLKSEHEEGSCPKQ